MQPFRLHPVPSVAVLLCLLSAACGGAGGDATNDAAAVPPADSAASAIPADSPAVAQTPRDADQEFLRRMVDHHQGLILMAQQAMERGSTDSVKAEAHELHQKQETEQREMLAILQREYGDAHQPSVMPAHQAMLDSLTSKAGADYDMAFRMNVVAHHREGIKMTDEFLPRLARPEVKSMAERGKTDQQKDIQKLEAEMGHG
jgi:uncharacterized protein (DUF305 family)